MFPLIKKAAVIGSTFFLLIAFWPALKKDHSGPARVIDADTIEIGGERHRLLGLDAVEFDQICRTREGKGWSCGREAVHALGKFIEGRKVACEPRGQPDAYGRYVSICYAGSDNINAWVVRAGWAVADHDAGRTLDYTSEESTARFLGKGIWSGSWRRKNRHHLRNAGCVYNHALNEAKEARPRGRGLPGFRDGLSRRERALAGPSRRTEMAKSANKIVLSRSQDIPFNKLVLSQANVRRVRAGLSIEELAEDIARRTLLQSLTVRPICDTDGKETGMYEVPAGGRRYRALERLIKQKRLAKTTPIPCIVREDGIAEEDSLAENVQRVALHPLDQFRAFQTLKEKGLGEEEIAARFFVTPNVVRQRLKLASVSSKLLEVYAEDGMTLEQLMAFTVSSDHPRQEQVWEGLQRSWNKEPYHIKRLMTENAVRASDRRARFVGLAAYEAEGGIVMRDLFAQDDGGWLQDVTLLETLVAEKLDREADAIRAEGWKWVEVATDFPYGHTAALGRVTGQPVDLTDEERAEREALRDELERLEAEWAEADELPEEVDQRLGEIEATLEAFEERPFKYDPADIGRAGAFVSIGSDGALRVERGYLRPDDEAPAVSGVGDHDSEREGVDPSAPHAGVAATYKGETGADDEVEPEDDALKPLSDRLVMELTAHRTLALRDALASDPDTAFLAVLHALVLQTFYHYATDSCLEITTKNSAFSVQGPDLKECPSDKAVDARHETWAKQLPEEPKDLWDVLMGFDTDSRAALFAHCASLTVNAVHEPWNRAPGRKRHADQIATSLSLNMAAAGWRPTVDNYLGRVPKVRILEAVREAKGVAASELIDHLKKSEMAAEAERRLADTGWLPEPLRTPEIETEPTASVGEASTADAGLPAFLPAAE